MSLFFCRRIRKIISIYSTSTNIELQQRSVEYSALFKGPDTVRTGLLERMPILERAAQNGLANGHTGEEEEDILGGMEDSPASSSKPQLPTQNTEVVLLKYDRRV